MCDVRTPLCHGKWIAHPTYANLLIFLFGFGGNLNMHQRVVVAAGCNNATASCSLSRLSCQILSLHYCSALFQYFLICEIVHAAKMQSFFLTATLQARWASVQRAKYRKYWSTYRVRARETRENIDKISAKISSAITVPVFASLVGQTYGVWCVCVCVRAATQTSVRKIKC